MATGWKSSYFRYKELFLNVAGIYKKRADLRAFLEIVMSIMAVIVFTMFAIKPTALTIINLNQQIKEKQKTISVLTKKINDLQKANTLLTQNQSYLDDIDTAVASSVSPDIFIKQIEGIAAKNGVELFGVVVNDVTLLGDKKTARTARGSMPMPEGANEMEYSISVKGNFAGIDSFVKDLENLRVTSVMDSTTINSSITDAGRVIVAVISGRVPYLAISK